MISIPLHPLIFQYIPFQISPITTRSPLNAHNHPHVPSMGPCCIVSYVYQNQQDPPSPFHKKPDLNHCC